MTATSASIFDASDAFHKKRVLEPASLHVGYAVGCIEGRVSVHFSVESPVE